MTDPAPLLLHSLRGHLFLALQRLRRRPLGPYLRELRAWERLSPAELDRRHQERLRAVLAYARERVPLYRTEPWRTALRAGGGALETWPVLQRDVLAARAAEVRAMPPGPGQVELRTSGSSGRPVRIAMTREAETWTWAHRYRTLMWHGVAIGAPALRLSHDRRRLRDALLGHRHVPEPGTPEALERAAGYLRRARPVLVMGPPSALFQLARYLRESGVSSPPAQVGRVGGEQLFPFQRTEIESVLATRVVNAYGCTEVGAIAGECPAGALHVFTEHVHLEIACDGAPVPPGEAGDVLLTTLANPVMPLVRYRVGDRGRLSPDRCGCGLPHPLLLELEARGDETVLGPDGGRHPASGVVRALDRFFSHPSSAGVRQVQLEQTDRWNWRAWVEAPAVLRSAAAEAARRAMEARLESVMRDALGPGCRVEAHLVEGLQRRAGKFPYLR